MIALARVGLDDMARDGERPRGLDNGVADDHRPARSVGADADEPRPLELDAHDLRLSRARGAHAADRSAELAVNDAQIDRRVGVEDQPERVGAAKRGGRHRCGEGKDQPAENRPAAATRPAPAHSMDERPRGLSGGSERPVAGAPAGSSGWAGEAAVFAAGLSAAGLGAAAGSDAAAGLGSAAAGLCSAASAIRSTGLLDSR